MMYGVGHSIAGFFATSRIPFRRQAFAPAAES
jgi:hypothetical protein